MKILAYPNSTLTEAFDHKFSLHKLRFLSEEIEKKYQENLEKLMFCSVVKHKVTLVKFLHCTVLIIYAGAYLLELSELYQSNSLKFRLILILSNLLLTIILAYFPNRMCLKSAKKWADIGIIQFTYTSIVLILNDNYFQKLAFSNTGPMHFNSLYGLFALVLLYSNIPFGNYIHWLFSSIFIVLLYSVFRFLSNTENYYGILEIVILALVQSFLVSSNYISDFSERQKYIDKANPEKEKLISSEEPQSQDFRLQECIRDMHKILPQLKKNDLKQPIERTIGLLENLIIDNRNRLSMEKGNLEDLMKNLDEEDKIYLRESWSSPTNILNVRSRDKVKKISLNEKNSEKREDPNLILIIKQIGKNWNLNTFEIDKQSSLGSLVTVGMQTVKMYLLVDVFLISEMKMQNFFESLEIKYKSNPYHNSCHAADILISALYIVNKSFAFEHLSDIEVLSLIIAHLGHDVGHPGFTNRFLVNFQDKLALKCNFYSDNDISVLENLHSSIVFKTLFEKDNNFLSTLELNQFLQVRKLVIEMILATDMGKHFETIGIFRAKYYTADSIEAPECKLDFLKLLIKASDIGHAAKNTDLHSTWTNLICEEFFHQGDIEKESGKPVSMYCDRETTIIPKSQIGFLKNIALPLYETLNSFLNSNIFEEECIGQIKNNIAYWEMQLALKKKNSLNEGSFRDLIPEPPSSISLGLTKSTITVRGLHITNKNSK